MPLFEQFCCNGSTYPQTLKRIRPCQLSNNSSTQKGKNHKKGKGKSKHVDAVTASSGNGTSADDDRMQFVSLKKGKEKGKDNSHDQHDQHELYRPQHVQECGRTGHWAKDCWNPGGGAYDNSAYRNTGKDKSKKHR